MKLFARLGVVVCALVVGSSAKADTITYSLDMGNPAISGFAGPYVSVLVDRTSGTTADITFTSLSSGSETFLTADGGTVAVNVNATSWTLSSILGVNVGTGFTPGPFSDGGSGNEDGFGSFNQRIDGFDGFTHSTSSVSFTLTNLSGSWASVADVLTPNENGFVAAAHVFVASCSSAASCDAGTGALATGFGTVGAVPVPEPGTAGMLGLGLTFLALARRR
jgi:hypothetical protein